MRNAIGLHARPAARFVETVRGFDADVFVAKEGGGREPVRATSLTNVVALGARFGDTLLVSAAGPQAQEAIAALQSLSDDGFGDGIAPGPVPPSSVLPAQAPANRLTPAGPPPPGSVLTGVPASAGLTSGPAHHLHGAFTAPPERPAGDPADERRRLSEAIAQAKDAIGRDRETVAARAGKAEAAIFDAHLVLLDDEALLEPAERAIGAGRHRGTGVLRRGGRGGRPLPVRSTSRCSRNGRPMCSTWAAGSCRR